MDTERPQTSPSGSRLEQFREGWEMALSVGAIGIWEWYFDSGELTWSDGQYEIYEIPQKTPVTFADFVERIHPEDRARFENEIDRVISKGVRLDSQFRLQTPSRKTKWVRIVGSVDLDPAGEPIKILGLSSDISELVKMKVHAKKQQEFIQTILDAIPDPVFVKDESLKYIYGNREFDRMMGTTRDNYLHKCDLDFFPEDQAAIFRQYDQMVMQDLRPTENEEYIRNPQTGADITAITKKTPCITPNGDKILVGVIRDITHRKTLEQDLEIARAREIEQSRLAALGQMAGGIAHEINNPLTIVHGRAQVMLDKLKRKKAVSEEEMISIFELIVGQSERIARVVRGMRNCIRGDSDEVFTRIKVADIVEDALGVCQEKFRDHEIEIVKELESGDAIQLSGNRTALSQILINLLGNAFDALNEARVDNPQIHIETKILETNLELRVWDNGPGVPPGFETKIMQPFFTTKETGKGTGLGLHISLNIAKEHGGELLLDRKKSDSCFLLKLPFKHVN
jgi:PAS domain S-box-containing protein